MAIEDHSSSGGVGLGGLVDLRAREGTRGCELDGMKMLKRGYCLKGADPRLTYL